jgi:hypothetical protein
MRSSRYLLLLWALASAGCGGLACTRNTDCPKALTCSDIGECTTPPPPPDGGAGDGGDSSSAADEVKKLLGL